MRSSGRRSGRGRGSRADEPGVGRTRNGGQQVCQSSGNIGASRDLHPAGVVCDGSGVDITNELAGGSGKAFWRASGLSGRDYQMGADWRKLDGGPHPSWLLEEGREGAVIVPLASQASTIVSAIAGKATATQLPAHGSVPIGDCSSSTSHRSRRRTAAGIVALTAFASVVASLFEASRFAVARLRGELQSLATRLDRPMLLLILRRGAGKQRGPQSGGIECTRSPVFLCSWS